MSNVIRKGIEPELSDSERNASLYLQENKHNYDLSIDYNDNNSLRGHYPNEGNKSVNFTSGQKRFPIDSFKRPNCNNPINGNTYNNLTRPMPQNNRQFAMSPPPYNDNFMIAQKKMSVKKLRTQVRCQVCCSSVNFNDLIRCTICGITVHGICYGVTATPFICNLCKVAAPNNLKRSMIRCAFCLKPEGALKEGLGGYWVHIQCVLLSNGMVRFQHPMIRFNAIGIQQALITQQQGATPPCIICQTREGFVTKCYVPNCNYRMHVTCALYAGFSFNLSPFENKLGNVLPPFLYCAHHSAVFKSEHSPQSTNDPRLAFNATANKSTTDERENNNNTNISNNTNVVLSHNNVNGKSDDLNFNNNTGNRPMMLSSVPPNNQPANGPTSHYMNYQMPPMNMMYGNKKFPPMNYQPQMSPNYINPMVNCNKAFMPVVKTTMIPNSLPPNNAMPRHKNPSCYWMSNGGNDPTMHSTNLIVNQQLPSGISNSAMHVNNNDIHSVPTKLHPNGPVGKLITFPTAFMQNIAARMDSKSMKSFINSNNSFIINSYQKWRTDMAETHPFLGTACKPFDARNSQIKDMLNNRGKNNLKPTSNDPASSNGRNIDGRGNAFNKLYKMNGMMQDGTYEKGLKKSFARRSQSIKAQGGTYGDLKNPMRHSSVSTARVAIQSSRSAKPRASDDFVNSNAICTRGQRFSWQRLELYFSDNLLPPLKKMINEFSNNDYLNVCSLARHMWIDPDFATSIKYFNKLVKTNVKTPTRQVLISCVTSDIMKAATTPHYFCFYDSLGVKSLLPLTNDVSKFLNDFNYDYGSYDEPLEDNLFSKILQSIYNFADQMAEVNTLAEKDNLPKPANKTSSIRISSQTQRTVSNLDVLAYNDLHTLERAIHESICTTKGIDSASNDITAVLDSTKPPKHIGSPKMSTIFSFFILLNQPCNSLLSTIASKDPNLASSLIKFLSDRESTTEHLQPSVLRKTASPSKKMFMHGYLWDLNPFISLIDKDFYALLAPNTVMLNGIDNNTIKNVLQEQEIVPISNEVSTHWLNSSQKLRSARAQQNSPIIKTLMSNDELNKASNGEQLVRLLSSEKYWKTLLFSDNFVQRQMVSCLLLWAKNHRTILKLYKKILRIVDEFLTEPPTYGANDRAVACANDAAFIANRWAIIRNTFEQGHQDPLESVIERVKHEREINAEEIVMPTTGDPAAPGASINCLFFCHICFGMDNDSLNPLTKCERCNIRVHASCYGVGSRAQLEVESLSWLCDVCNLNAVSSKARTSLDKRMKNNLNTYCCVCLTRGGPMKRISGNGVGFSNKSFVHLTCAFWLAPIIECKNLMRVKEFTLTVPAIDVLASESFQVCHYCKYKHIANKLDIDIEEAMCMTDDQIDDLYYDPISEPLNNRPFGYYGLTVKCANELCDIRVHPLCAWLSGCYVTAKSNYRKNFKITNSNYLPRLEFSFLCNIHSDEIVGRLPTGMIAQHRQLCYHDHEVFSMVPAINPFESTESINDIQEKYENDSDCNNSDSQPDYSDTEDNVLQDKRKTVSSSSYSSSKSMGAAGRRKHSSASLSDASKSVLSDNSFSEAEIQSNDENEDNSDFKNTSEAELMTVSTDEQSKHDGNSNGITGLLNADHANESSGTETQQLTSSVSKRASVSRHQSAKKNIEQSRSYKKTNKSVSQKDIRSIDESNTRLMTRKRLADKKQSFVNAGKIHFTESNTSINSESDGSALLSSNEVDKSSCNGSTKSTSRSRRRSSLNKTSNDIPSSGASVVNALDNQETTKSDPALTSLTNSKENLEKLKRGELSGSDTLLAATSSPKIVDPSDRLNDFFDSLLVCQVCLETLENANIITCTKCNKVVIHEKCQSQTIFRLRQNYISNGLCLSCKQLKPLSCSICYLQGGPLIYADKYPAHPFCFSFHKIATLRQLKAALESTNNRPCDYCNNEKGVKFVCEYEGCYDVFHAACYAINRKKTYVNIYPMCSKHHEANITKLDIDDVLLTASSLASDIVSEVKNLETLFNNHSIISANQNPEYWLLKRGKANATIELKQILSYLTFEPDFDVASNATATSKSRKAAQANSKISADSKNAKNLKNIDRMSKQSDDTSVSDVVADQIEQSHTKVIRKGPSSSPDEGSAEVTIALSRPTKKTYSKKQSKH